MRLSPVQWRVSIVNFDRISRGRRNAAAYTPIPAARTRSRRDAILALTDVVVVLRSAGAFTALYKVITAFIDRNKGRSVSLSVGNKKITITGHNMPEELERY
jgi:hypothetical protein